MHASCLSVWIKPIVQAAAIIVIAECASRWPMLESRFQRLVGLD
jgi:hypothetical protein